MSEELKEFLAESLEVIDRLENSLVANPEVFSNENLQSLIRDLHSLKGTSGFFNLPKFQAIVHVAEDVVRALQLKEIPAGERAVDSLLRSLDGLRSIIVNYESAGQERVDQYVEILSQLTELNSPAPQQRSTQLKSEDASSSAPAPIFQLIYTSVTPNKRMDTLELVQILQQARKNNLRDGLSGMLVYRDNYFMQVLEGPEEAVTKTFQKIAKDSRHSYLVVLAKRYVAKRSFPDWQMGFHMMRCMKKAKIEGLAHVFDDDTNLQGKDFARELIRSFKDNRELM